MHLFNTKLNNFYPHFQVLELYFYIAHLVLINELSITYLSNTGIIHSILMASS